MNVYVLTPYLPLFCSYIAPIVNTERAYFLIVTEVSEKSQLRQLEDEIAIMRYVICCDVLLFTEGMGRSLIFHTYLLEIYLNYLRAEYEVGKDWSS